MSQRHCLRRGCGAFIRGVPMDSGEQFHAEWRLEALNEVDGAVEPLLCPWVTFEKITRRGDGVGQRLDLLVWPIATIGVATNEVALDPRSKHCPDS